MKKDLAQRVRHARRRGFTLTEIAIVLGIVGLILGAIWVAAAAVYNNLRVSRANTEILQIAQGVRTLYGGSSTMGTAAGNITDSLVCAKAVPADLVNGACGGPATMINPWAGGTTAVYTPATGDSFTIEMTNVPQANCINLLMATGGTSRDPNLFNATATSGAQKAAVATPSSPVLAVTATPALANAAVASGFGGCNAGGAGGTVAVQFAFGLK